MDGHSALTLLDTGPRPDAIVLNIMLPNMSGWQFRAKQLLTPELASIPTLILTATGNQAHAAIDADEVLPKPITPDQVLAALLRHVRANPSSEDEVKTNPKLRALVLQQTSVTTDELWQIVPAIHGESLRWEAERSSRWVALSFGEGAEIGRVIVEDSNGSRQTFDRYEDALEFCNQIRGDLRAVGN
jgi:two-component SAPR family response regulator